VPEPGGGIPAPVIPPPRITARRCPTPSLLLRAVSIEGSAVALRSVKPAVPLFLQPRAWPRHEAPFARVFEGGAASTKTESGRLKDNASSGVKKIPRMRVSGAGLIPTRPAAKLRPGQDAALHTVLLNIYSLHVVKNGTWAKRAVHYYTRFISLVLGAYGALFVARSGLQYRSPGIFKIYGSQDGSVSLA
jgi:hypothetical protein